MWSHESMEEQYWLLYLLLNLLSFILIFYTEMDMVIK